MCDQQRRMNKEEEDDNENKSRQPPRRQWTSQSSSAESTSPSKNISSSFELVRHLSHHSDWDMYNDDMERFVQECPKVELHVHLDGSFDPVLLWQHIQQDKDSALACLPISKSVPWQAGRTLPVRSMVQACQDARQYHKLCTCRGYRSLKEMLNCFEVFLPTVRSNLTLIEQLAYDFCHRQYEQHVVYTEVRYSPHLLADDVASHSPSNLSADPTNMDPEHYGGDGNQPVRNFVTMQDNSPSVSAEDVYQAVTAGLRRGCTDCTGIVVNQILCAITWHPEWAMPTLDLYLKHKDDSGLCGVVGIDVAAGEEHFQPPPCVPNSSASTVDDINNNNNNSNNFYTDMHLAHFDMMQRARSLGVPITLHAGEVHRTTTSTELNVDHGVGSSPASNVWHAIQTYGAQRIGHGYRIMDDPDLIEFVREQGIHVEVCPTSSLETGGWIDTEDHEVAIDWKQHPAVAMLQHGINLGLNSDDPAVFHTSLAWQYRIALAKMDWTMEDILHSNENAIQSSFGTPEQKAAVLSLIAQYRTLLLEQSLITASSTSLSSAASSLLLREHDDTPWQQDDNNDMAKRSVMLRRRSWHSSMSESFSDRVYLDDDVNEIES